MGRFYLTLLLLIPFKLYSQQFTPDPDWRFDNFNSQNHFISRLIGGITGDNKGYIWTCGAGVERFDGFRTVEFNSFSQADGSLKSNYTAAITDNNGRVWISSEGLCYYDDASGKFIYVQPGIKHNITYAYSFFLQDNYLWFACDYGLAKIDVRTLKISFTSLTGIADPMCISLMGENTLLISSRQKVYIYNTKKDSYTASVLMYDHTLVKISSVIRNRGDVFLGTTRGLFILKDLKHIYPVADQAKDVEINDLLFLPGDKEQKYLFLATEGKGLMIYNTALRKIEFTYVHDENNPFTIASNIISDLFVDKAGRLWLSTELGISMLDFSNQQWKMRFIDKANTDVTDITRISVDISDSSKIWMASKNRGMMLVNWKEKKIQKIFSTSAEMQNIEDFSQLSKNKWLLVTKKKIMEWSPAKGISCIRKIPVSDSVAISYYIRRIIRADPQTAFITTNRGLLKYKTNSHKVSVVVDTSKTDKEVSSGYDLLTGFYENGKLWIASRNGLFNYNVANGAIKVYNGKKKLDYFFFDICDAGSNQVICSDVDGIAIFNRQTTGFNIVNPLANLFNVGGLSVAVKKHTVWVSTTAGLLTYDLMTHTSDKVVEETPLMDIAAKSPFAFIGNDIALGFKRGYAYFTPDLNRVTFPSDPVIESVSVNNQPLLHQFKATRNSPRLILSHTDNSVDIAFTAFSYDDPTHVNFRYRLKGADNKWQYTGDQRSANYAQLAPGNYTFYVQSGNKTGNWNTHLASVSFIILPPFWASWWFRTLVILVIILILYSLYRYKINHMRAVERMREKIASDFHDDIGSALSSISIFSEVANNQLDQRLPREQTKKIVGHISLSARAMLDAMDDIVWAVNPRNDHLGNLAVRMREFAIPLLEASKIKFDINIQEDIRSTSISMEARKNIFMVFKECINNILKHSCCTAMQVSVKKLNNQLEFVIADNGKGFDMQAQSNRNGLKNIRRRAGEIKGTLQISSGPGSGTTVRLLVNTI